MGGSDKHNQTYHDTRLERVSLPWVPEATRLLNPAGQTSVRSEVSEGSEGPNASSTTLGTRGNSLAKSGRPNECEVRSERRERRAERE